MIRVGDRIRTHTRLGRPTYGTVVCFLDDFFGRPNPLVRFDDGSTELRLFDDVELHAPARPEWK